MKNKIRSINTFLNIHEIKTTYNDKKLYCAISGYVIYDCFSSSCFFIFVNPDTDTSVTRYYHLIRTHMSLNVQRVTFEMLEFYTDNL